MLHALRDLKSRQAMPKPCDDNLPSPSRRKQYRRSVSQIKEESTIFRRGLEGFHALSAGQSLGIALFLKGINERKREFSLSQVVSARFSDGFVVVIVEDIIANLETQADPTT